MKAGANRPFNASYGVTAEGTSAVAVPLQTSERAPRNLTPPRSLRAHAHALGWYYLQDHIQA